MIPDYPVGTAGAIKVPGDGIIPDITYPCHALIDEKPLCGYSRHPVVPLAEKWSELLEFQQCPNCRKIVLRAETAD